MDRFSEYQGRNPYEDCEARTEREDVIGEHAGDLERSGDGRRGMSAEELDLLLSFRREVKGGRP